MNILGHGIDLVPVADIQRWLADPRDPFLPRCFTPSELAQLPPGPNRPERVAGRFAAKEAVLKALGTGFGGDIAFSDVIIQREFNRPPSVHLRRAAARAADQRGIAHWHLSISHTPTLAIASAIATADTPHRPR